jgi:hypothetical protein
MRTSWSKVGSGKPTVIRRSNGSTRGDELVKIANSQLVRKVIPRSWSSNSIVSFDS